MGGILSLGSAIQKKEDEAPCRKDRGETDG